MKSVAIVTSVIVAIIATALVLANLTSGDTTEPPIFTDAATAAASTPTPSPVATLPPTSATPMAVPTQQPGEATQITNTYFPTLSLNMVTGDSGRYILADGSSRMIKLLGTDLVYSEAGMTVWTTATVEVSGPGLDPIVKEIAATYFRQPEIIHGVRIWVDITGHFQPRELRDGGSILTDARLVLSDARLPMTDLSEFSWPVPDLVWQEGSGTTYQQGLQGTFNDDAFHHGAVDLGMPRGTPVYAWTNGLVTMTDRGFDFTVEMTNLESGLGTSIQGLHFEEVIPELNGQIVEKGTLLGYSGQATWYHIHWIYGFELAPIMAEWYMNEASPERLSFIKDWLVAGPYYNSADAERLETDYLQGEASVFPELGDPAADAREWWFWDNIVPGVVFVAETVSPFPNSGYAEIADNYPDGIVYMATYVESPDARTVELNVSASDAVSVWVGDRLVVNEDRCVAAGGTREGETPTINIDEFRVLVDLEAGWNRVLVKTAQRDGCPDSWQVAVRFLNESGLAVQDLVIDPLRGGARPELPPRPDERKLILSGVDPATLGQPSEFGSQVSRIEGASGSPGGS